MYNANINIWTFTLQMYLCDVDTNVISLDFLIRVLFMFLVARRLELPTTLMKFERRSFISSEIKTTCRLNA